MSDPSWADYLTAAGTIGAALAAAWAALAASRASRDTADLTRIERERWDAAQRAYVTARFEWIRKPIPETNAPQPGQRSTGWRMATVHRIVIVNSGSGHAFDVDFDIELVNQGGAKPLDRRALPVLELGPGQTHIVPFGFVDPVQTAPYPARIRWRDAAGDHDKPLSLVEVEVLA